MNRFRSKSYYSGKQKPYFAIVKLLFSNQLCIDLVFNNTESVTEEGSGNLSLLDKLQKASIMWFGKKWK